LTNTLFLKSLEFREIVQVWANSSFFVLTSIFIFPLPFFGLFPAALTRPVKELNRENPRMEDPERDKNCFLERKK